MNARSPGRMLILMAVRFGDQVDPRLRRVVRNLAAPLVSRLKAPVVLPRWDLSLNGGPAGRSTSGPAAGAQPQRSHATGPAPLVAMTVDQGAPPVATSRCLLITESLDVGGMDMVVAFLARGLRHHGFLTSVMVVAEESRSSLEHVPSGHRNTIANLLVDEGVEVVWCASPREAGAELARIGADVISAHGSPTWVLEAAYTQGIPVVECLHGMHWLFEADKAAIQARDELLTRVVAVSGLLATEYLLACPAAPAAKVVTIPNAVDPSRLRPTVRADRDAVRGQLGLNDEFLVVSLARHCLQKNTYGLVRAFLEVAAQHDDVHLLLTGDPSEPEYVAQVQALIAASRFADRVHLRDHCPDPSLLLSAADAFVLDSFFEGWALSSMEALCHGVPVVLSDVAGAREQVEGGVPSGVLVPNPLGRSTGVDWSSLGRARYAEQENQPALVEALSEMASDRLVWRGRRPEIATDARRRFDREECLRSHAEVLYTTISDKMH